MYSEKICLSLVRFGSKSVNTSEISIPAASCLPCRSGWGGGGVSHAGGSNRRCGRRNASALSVQACQRGRRAAALGSPPSRPVPAQLAPDLRLTRDLSARPGLWFGLGGVKALSVDVTIAEPWNKEDGREWTHSGCRPGDRQWLYVDCQPRRYAGEGPKPLDSHLSQGPSRCL